MRRKIGENPTIDSLARDHANETASRALSNTRVTNVPKTTRRNLILGAAAVALAGCSTQRVLVNPPSIGTGLGNYPGQPPQPIDGATDARLLFVTDRERAADGSFGTDRARAVSYGEAEIAIGDNETTWEDLLTQGHKSPSLSLKKVTELGQLPASPLPFRIENGSPVDIPDVRSAYERAQSALQNEITKRLRASGTGDVLLHVPGVNTGFEEGAFALTDIWHHAGRRAVPIVYSWPSGRDGLFGYFTDRESGEFTIFHLKEFLRELYQNPAVKRIHVIAHSRGTDIATSALRELLIETRAKGLNPRTTFKIDNLILAAPDLDFEIVGQRLVSERFGTAFGRVTVYINRGDSALSLSQRLMDGVRFGRLLPEEVPETEQIIFGNVQKVNFIRVEKAGGRFGHSYYRENAQVLSDIILLLNTCAAPGSATRPLQQLSGNFWLLPENYASDRAAVVAGCS